MNTQKTTLAAYDAMSREELLRTNGGIGPALLLLWCEYLLGHDDQLINGFRDGYIEFMDTLTN
jgi:hypothetical protein